MTRYEDQTQTSTAPVARPPSSPALLEDEETPTGVVSLAAKRAELTHKECDEQEKKLREKLQALRDRLTDSGKLARRRAAK